MNKYIFILLCIAATFVQPAIALFAGIFFAFFCSHPYPRQARKLSKYFLQIAVVGLGFGMNLHRSLEAGKEGMIFTILSVTGVIAIGYLLGKWFRLPSRLAYLISSGTAICGGSAIAAVAPVVHADDNEISISLAVIFCLNALALFLFPPIGHWLGLTEQQFGLWAAIAIHDTSSVVGAGASYGPEALAVATTVKLTRALWIIPLSFVSVLFFKNTKGGKITIPWFIAGFVGAMVLNTYLHIPQPMLQVISTGSHKLLSATLFLIGSSLSIKAMKSVGLKPIIFGILLWLLISVTTLTVLMVNS